MKTKLLILLTLIISFLQKSNDDYLLKQNVNISDQDIYELINLHLKETKQQDSLENFQFKYIINQTVEPTFVINKHLESKLNQYFSNSDIEFIHSQLNYRKNFKIHQDSIIRKIVISRVSLDSMLDKNSYQQTKNFKAKYGELHCEEFSLPVFSIDKKTAIMEINSSLGGGYSIIFEKQNNGWKRKIFLLKSH